MRVHLYTISWNEERMLSFFFRHYDPLVERYVFHDDGSTDGTLELLSRHSRVEIRRFPRPVEGSYVLSAQHLHNNVWKESRQTCDWVIVTAVDEHLHHPEMPEYLNTAHKNGITAIPALGYQMIATEFPSGAERLSASLTCGAPFSKMSKLSIFRPDAIEETNFAIGRHSAAPTGSICYPKRDEVLNFHFKYLGLDYLRSRHAMLQTGLGQIDRARGWGHRYSFSDALLEADFREFESRAVDVARPDLDHHVDHSEPRWWRGHAGFVGAA